MRLNEKIAGLPRWPYIEANADGSEIMVRGKHISYGRYSIVKWFFNAIATVWFVFSVLAIFALMGHDKPLLPFFVMFGQFMVCCVIFALLPLAFWACWLLNRRTTRVRFTQSAIIINGESHDATANVDIQFRANRPQILRGYDRHGKPRYGLYELSFMRVEMVYGARLVPITSIDEAEKAQEFAVALQCAFRLARAQQTKRPTFGAIAGALARKFLPE